MMESNAILHTRPTKTIPLTVWQASVSNGYSLLPAKAVNDRGVRYLSTEDIKDLWRGSGRKVKDPINDNWLNMQYVCRNKMSMGYAMNVMEDPKNIVMAHVIPINIPMNDHVLMKNKYNEQAETGRTYHKRGALVSSICVFEHREEDGGVQEHFYIHLICNGPMNAQGKPWDEKTNGVEQGGRILAELVEATALLNGVNVRLTPASDCGEPGVCKLKPKCATHVWRRNGYRSVSKQSDVMIKELVHR